MIFRHKHRGTITLSKEDSFLMGKLQVKVLLFVLKTGSGIGSINRIKKNVILKIKNCKICEKDLIISDFYKHIKKEANGILSKISSAFKSGINVSNVSGNSNVIIQQ